MSSAPTVHGRRGRVVAVAGLLACGLAAPAHADLSIALLGAEDRPVAGATVWVEAADGAIVKAMSDGDGTYVLPGDWAGAINVWVEHESCLPSAVCPLPVPPAGATAKMRIADAVIASFEWPGAPGGLPVGPPPPNDACADAVPLAVPSITPGTTVGASQDGAPFCGTSNTAPGVWYSVVGDGSAYTATTCSPDTAYDTKLTVYAGGCGTLACVTGNDDDFSCPSSIFHSTVTWCSEPGVEYLILVHGFGTSNGFFELDLFDLPISVNDDACDAVQLSLGVAEATSFNNICATAQPGEVSPGAGTGANTCNSQDGWCDILFVGEPSVQNSLWYTFEAPDSGAVTIDAGPGDSQLAVYEVGDCADFGTFVALAGNDDGGPFLSARIDAFECERLTPGATYYVQLDGFDGALLAGDIIIVDLALDPPIDCNGNGIDDACDLAGGGSADCNGNGVPDDCEDVPDCACATITVEILTDNFPSETGWSLVDQDSGATIFEVPGGSLTSGATLHTWDVAVSALGCYDFTITDAFGDGICCGFGLGSYEVLYEGASVATGGAFGSSETVNDVGDCGASSDCNENGIVDDCDTAPEDVAPAEDGAADDCEDALPICPGVAYSGTTAGATQDGPFDFCDGAVSILDVWYRYRPNWSGSADFSWYGSPMDVVVEIWAGCPTVDGVRLACSSSPDTDVVVEVERLEDYWIRIAGPGFTTGEYAFSIVGPDCNLNPDDTNGNGTPDECECLADVNGDGIVSLIDLAIVTANLGANGCPSDVDGSGTVTEADQILVLDNLGPCPNAPCAQVRPNRKQSGSAVLSPVARTR